VVIGGASVTTQTTQGPAFTISNVPDGPRDLVAARAIHNANGTVTVARLVLRRATNYANGASIPALDFTGPESVQPVPHAITLPNLGGDQATISEGLVTATGATAPFYTASSFFNPTRNADVVQYPSFPDASLTPADLHGLGIVATPPGSDPTSARFVYLLLRPPADPTVTQAVTFGPSLGAATVTGLGGAPYPRLRAQVASQAAYGAAVAADYSQNDRAVSLSMTTSYAGGAPSTWTLDVPDLSAAGYDPTWGLHTGARVSWSVNAVGGNVLAFIGGTPVDGAQIIGAVVSGSTSASVQLLRR